MDTKTGSTEDKAAEILSITDREGKNRRKALLHEVEVWIEN
jgi:hypothetical protein